MAQPDAAEISNPPGHDPNNLAMVSSSSPGDRPGR